MQVISRSKDWQAKLYRCLSEQEIQRSKMRIDEIRKDIKFEYLLLSSGPSWYNNCNDNTVFLLFCVHGNYLSHFQTGKMHEID